jgi:hypothetical protein
VRPSQQIDETEDVHAATTSASVTRRESTGWTMQTRIDTEGRTLFSIYIGEVLVVKDEPNADVAVVSARHRLTKLRDSRSGTKEDLWQQNR